eukprot:gene8617-564_t
MIQWKEFKKIHDRNELKKAASEIFESFIMDDSEFELNLSVKFKKEMYTIFNNKEIKVDTDIFNGVAFDVEWMLSDCLERFQQKINEKEEVTSKQFFGRLSTMSRKIRRIKGLVNEGIQAFDRERRRSSSNSNSLYISNNTIDIIKNQSKLQHNSFFENDDDDKEEFFSLSSPDNVLFPSSTVIPTGKNGAPVLHHRKLLHWH